MINVDSESFLTIVVVAALAALAAGLAGPRVVIPVVVLEIVLGILVGPDVLGLAEADAFIDFFSSLGLGMLFFFAGYEIDFERIRGSPLRLGVLGWVLSLALAYAVGGLLALTGVVLSLLFTGSALATTAIGTLIPILRDAGELRTRFGTYLLAAGAMGEFGPILLITLVFSTRSAATNAGLLVAFIVLSVVASVVAVRGVQTHWALIERTLESSGQLAVRIAVVVVFALAALAASLGLDLLLGGFAAGVIVRVALKGREVSVFESKLTAVGYGFFIPFFFVVSGIKFELSALTEEPLRLLELPLFLALFLLVRGLPALVLYRGELDRRARAALAFFTSTELPLVVAITTIAVDQGHMRSSTAASLIGAAILSTMVFPLVGLRLRRPGGHLNGAFPNRGWARSRGARWIGPGVTTPGSGAAASTTRRVYTARGR
jgi:Kef-type K+ transport system membrane component KefB